RALAVPHAEHAIELAFATQLGLLRAPQRSRGEVFVQARLEYDIGAIEPALGAHELLVEPAERRAAVAGHVARGVEPGAAVELLLHQGEPHQRLVAGREDAALGQIIFVVERDMRERHRASPQPQQSAPAAAAPPEASMKYSCGSGSATPMH